MQEGIFVSESAEKRGFQEWLFNPFRYVAGGVAFVIGLAVILLSALVCYTVPVHFDGVLDVHFGKAGPLWLFVAEGLNAWLCMALTLQVFGAILAPSRFRFIDMLGTQALARWPYLLIAIVCLPAGVRKVLQYLTERAMEQPHTGSVTTADVLVAVLALVVLIAATIWTVMLMYRGYVVATGMKQVRRRIISFIIGLIIAEVVSKVVFIVMAVKAGVLTAAAQT